MLLRKKNVDPTIGGVWQQTHKHTNRGPSAITKSQNLRTIALVKHVMMSPFNDNVYLPVHREEKVCVNNYSAGFKRYCELLGY